MKKNNQADDYLMKKMYSPLMGMDTETQIESLHEIMGKGVEVAQQLVVGHGAAADATQHRVETPHAGRIGFINLTVMVDVIIVRDVIARRQGKPVSAV